MNTRATNITQTLNSELDSFSALARPSRAGFSRSSTDISKRTFSAGFSLTEVVLALGIFAGALGGVALFPVLLGQARTSAEETRAAHLAHQILDDLNSCQGSKRSLVRLPLPSSTSQPASPSAGDAGLTDLVDLDISGTYNVYYDQDGNPVADTDPVANLKAEVTVLKPETLRPRLSQVTIRVSSLHAGSRLAAPAFSSKISYGTTEAPPTSNPPVAVNP